MPRRILLAAAALAAAVGMALFARRGADATALGDKAVIETYTLLAARGELLLGPYSRFQWHHPGPLYFFLMVPFYMLSGLRQTGLNAGALALNLAALSVVALIVIKRAGGGLAIAIGSAIAVFSWRAGPILTSAWNPHVPVFALFALVVAAADTVAGRVLMLPVVAAFASLVGQTHVGLLPTALALGVLALLSVVVRWGRGHGRDERRALWWTVGVVAVLWMPPLLEQFSSHPGNITQLWAFFVSGSHAGQRIAAALSVWSDMLSGLLRPDFEVARGLRFRPGSGRWTETVAALQIAALGVSGIFAIRARRQFEAALAALLLLTTLLALWSATRIEQTIFDHEVFWIAAVGALNLAVMISLVVSFGEGRLFPPVSRRAATAWCAVLFSMVALDGIRHLRADVLESSNVDPASQAASDVARQLREYLARESVVRPLVRIDQDAWPLAAGVILRLQKDHVAVAVEDDWIAMFTPAFSASGTEPVELSIQAKPQHVRTMGRPGELVVIEHDPQLFVHRTRR